MLIAYFDDTNTFADVVERSCALLSEKIHGEVEFLHVSPTNCKDPLYLNEEGNPEPPPVSLSDGTMVARSEVDRLAKEQEDVLFLLDISFDRAELRRYGLRIAHYLRHLGVVQKRILLFTSYPQIARDQAAADHNSWFDCHSKENLSADASVASQQLCGRLLMVVGELWKSSLAAVDERVITDAVGEMNAVSQVMKDVVEECLRVADSEIRIFLNGPTGAGKGFLANFIHCHSSRRSGLYMKINLAEYPPDLIGANLFGYKKGAFTSGVTETKGILSATNGGTLFIDEIGELPLDCQVKLLSFLDDGYYLPIQSTVRERSNARVISATNANIQELINNRKFKPDLYYRLCHYTIAVPPLQERKQDIPILASVFLRRICASNRLEPEALNRLMDYSWPGNVRELETTIMVAVKLSAGQPIRIEHLKFGDPISGINAKSALSLFDAVHECVLNWKKEKRYTQFMGAFGALVDRLSTEDISKMRPRAKLVYDVLDGALKEIVDDPIGVLHGRDRRALILRKLGCLLGELQKINECAFAEFHRRSVGERQIPEWSGFAKNNGGADPRDTWRGCKMSILSQIVEVANGLHE